MNKSELIDAIAKDAESQKLKSFESFVSNVTETLKKKTVKYL
jgi:nucleoid DNA-binding protein